VSSKVVKFYFRPRMDTKKYKAYLALEALNDLVKLDAIIKQ